MKITVPVEALTKLIGRELASIGAIDSAMPLERKPGYVIVMRAAKLGKQASVEQMAAMLRQAGVAQLPPPSPLEPLLKQQTKALTAIATAAVLRAMQMTEAAIVAQYEELLGTMEGSFGEGFEKCWRRARKHLVVLTAHLGDWLALPLPPERYFATDERKVCFRCLFDRPGNLPPLERTDPHPYTYICRACHEETLGDFPPDLLDNMTEARVIEHALGRPSKLKAETKVLNELAGLAPDLPAPPLPRKAAFDMAPRRRMKQPEALATYHVSEMTAEERAYIEMLFDYDSPSAYW
jgi:hypothetical protein